MPDYHHDLWFGVSVAPQARDPEGILATAELADRLGLDLIGFQDHPYQPGFLDAWTLLSFVAARTHRLRLFTNVANVPLRPPAMLARSAAALDILSGGRVELGVGAGYLLQQIAAMGAPRRSMPELVDALEEAIRIMRALWKPGPPVFMEGRYYSTKGAQPGPTPAHAIGIWLGAYKRRMLRLTGRAGDGWIPSLGYAWPEELGEMSQVIDEAAREAGRDPAAIRRAYNVTGSFAPGRAGFLQGPAEMWSEQLTELAVEHGFSSFNLAVSAGAEKDIRVWIEEVAPAVREAVSSVRARPQPRSQPGLPNVAAELHDGGGARSGAGSEGENDQRSIGLAGQQLLLAIHEQLRQELTRLVKVIGEVREGRIAADEARTYLNTMTMRQNYWTLGAFCAAYCRTVSVHHTIEDQQMFPDLKAADQSLGPILQRLRHDHEEIATVLDEVDAALILMVERPAEGLRSTAAAVDRLSLLLLAHLSFEETSLLEPIGRLAIRI